MNKASVLILAKMEPMLRDLIWNKAPDHFELAELGSEASEQEIVDQLKKNKLDKTTWKNQWRYVNEK